MERADLTRRIEEFPHYYFLVLAVSQGVVLVVFGEKLRDIFFSKSIPVPWVLAITAGYLFLLTLGLSYSYYWFTLYYRRVVRFLDVILPMCIAISQVMMAATLEQSGLYLLGVFAFYSLSLVTLIVVRSYTAENSFDERAQQLVKSKLAWMILNAVLGMAISFLFLCSLTLQNPALSLWSLAPSNSELCSVPVFASAMFALLLTYHLWTLSLMQGVAEYYAVEKAKVVKLRLSFLQSLSMVAFAFIGTFYVAYVGVQLMPGRIYDLSWAWDSVIPFWPCMYFFYYSVLAIPVLLYYFVKDPDQISTWSAASTAAILIAFFLFLFFPTKESTNQITLNLHAFDFATLLSLLDLSTGVYNLFPSLHVALSIIAFWALWNAANRSTPIGAGLLTWFFLILASTLLTHKHHILDLVGAVVCAGAAEAAIEYTPIGAYGNKLMKKLQLIPA